MKTIKLGDICKKIGSGATPRGGSKVYLSSGISLIRSQNVYNQGFNIDGLAHIGEVHAKELSNVIVEPNDILVNITGDSVARCCQVPDEVLPARVNQHVAIIRPDENEIDPKYLRYYLISPFMQSFMFGLAASGGTRNALTKEMIESINIYVPTLIEQHAIAEVLGSLDDKIELNRRINATLEEMAQALFKHWFVENPEASTWNEKKLGEIADVNWGDTNTTKQSYTEEGYPAYSAKGQDGYLPYFDFNKTGVIVSAIGANSGNTWLALGKWSCIKNTIRFWSTTTDISTEYLYYYTYGKEKWPLRGSAQPFIAQGDARLINIKIPTNNLAIRFGKIVQPMHELIYCNNEQNLTLANIRDWLLPRFMRGEMRVTNWE